MPAAGDRHAGGLRGTKSVVRRAGGLRGTKSVVRPQWPLLGLLTMSAAVFLSVTTELLPTGLLPAMSRDLGVTAGRLGLIVTGFALMVALFATPIGLALAWVPRRRLLVAALIGYAVCNLVTAFSHWYPLTFGARLLGGLTHGAFWGMLGGYAGRIVPPELLGRAITITSAGGTAAVLLGVPAGTALGTAFGWRAAFVTCAVVGLLLAVVCLRLLPDVPGRPAADRVRMTDLVRLPQLAFIVTVTALTMLGHFSFSTYVAPFLLHAGLAERAIGPVLLLNGVTGLIGLVLTGLLADRAPRAVMLAASAALTGSFLVLAVAGGSLPVAIAASAATGLSLGALPVILQAVTLRAAPHAPEQASALNASAFNVGIGGGALLGGLALDRWGAPALPVIAATLVGLGLITLVLARQVGVLPSAPPAPSPATVEHLTPRTAPGRQLLNTWRPRGPRPTWGPGPGPGP